MKTSEQSDKVLPALWSALAAMKNPGLDSLNPFFKSKYASLAGVRETVMPTLIANGLAVTQSLTTNEHGVCCSTRFLHQSGQWAETDGFTVPLGKNDAQAAAAAGTYGRRIDLMAACGVVGDLDDDGNAAAAHPPQEKAAQAPQAAPSAHRNMADVHGEWLRTVNAVGSSEALDAIRSRMQGERYSPSPAVLAACLAKRALFKQVADKQVEEDLFDKALGDAKGPNDPSLGKGG